MKRIFLLSLIFTLFCPLLLFSCSKSELKKDGFVFHPLSDGTYAVSIDESSLFYEEIVFPSSFKNKEVTQIAPPIEDHTISFEKMPNLKSITIPATVKKISSGAFANCKTLETVLFEEESALTEIGESAFASCENLSEITFPNSLKTIGEHAFEYCSSLKTVRLGRKLEKIGAYSFLGCKKLSAAYFSVIGSWSVWKNEETEHIADISDVTSSPEKNAIALQETYVSCTWKK